MTIKSSIITLTGEYTIANGEDNLRTKAGRQTLTELVDIVKTLFEKIGIDTTHGDYDCSTAYDRGWEYGIRLDDTTDNKSLARRMHRAIFKDSEDDMVTGFGGVLEHMRTSYCIEAYMADDRKIHIELRTWGRTIKAQAILEEVR